MFLLKPKVAAMSIAALALLSGCNDSDSTSTSSTSNTMMSYQYSITVDNLTNAQPVSPVALAFHDEGTLWQVGESASNALEVLAESGDNSGFLAESNIMHGESGTGVIMPGMSETIMVTVEDSMPQLLTIATMLVNTNDAFTGKSAVDLSNLMAGESISLYTRSYDAGTEENSELASSIPGPAAGGEGYNSERDDVDFVSMHPGVVSSDDGLMQSVLTEAHRFNNPTLMITISRVQ